MSDNSGAAEFQLISDGIIANYLTLSGLCLIAYDTILTFADELVFIWSQPIRLGTFLYVQARYGILFNLLVVSVIDFTADLNSVVFRVSVPILFPLGCTALNFSANLSLLAYLLGTQGLSLGRAYAVAPEKKLATIILGFILVLVQLIQITETVLAWSCNQGFAGPKARAYNYLNLSSNIITVLFEAGVLIITASKVWGLYRLERSSQDENDRLSLGTLCLRQSVFRFGMIFLFGLEQAISLNLSRFRLGGVEANIEFALSSILVCRFLLQLRKRHQENIDTPVATLTRWNAGLRDLKDSVIDEFGDSVHSSETISMMEFES